ncbi:MAG: arylsulfatase [Pirellulaceae bacterium]|nr:arylsulfatase [Pirellulaceae bacterium]
MLHTWITTPIATAADPPNIIYVLADDLGYGDLSCYGQSTLQTPNIDQMAIEGMRFIQHYAGSTVCAPSRCVLLTGKHIGHASVRGNQGGLILDEEITLAEMLRDRGYATGCVGKWGVGSPPPLDDPHRNGFDHFYGYVNMFHAHNFYPEFIVHNGQKVALRNVLAPKWKSEPPRPGREGRGVAQTKIDYVPDLVTAEALRFVESNQSKPFFLYYALNVPHANNEATGEPGTAGMEVPTLGDFSGKDWPEPEKGFASMIHNIDRDLGKLFAKLKSLGIDDNTVVFFTSDNGPHQEGGHQMPFFDSNGQLQGMKRDLFEGGIRVPLIVRWPGTIRPGATSGHICGFQDMMPTLAQISGADAPKLDGISIVPTLTGNDDQQEKHTHLYWEFTEKGGKQAVLKDHWKAVRLDWNKSPDGPIQLFDLANDLAESNDVAAQHPDVVATMVQIMRREHTQN